MLRTTLLSNIFVSVYFADNSPVLISQILISQLMTRTTSGPSCVECPATFSVSLVATFHIDLYSDYSTEEFTGKQCTRMAYNEKFVKIQKKYKVALAIDQKAWSGRKRAGFIRDPNNIKYLDALEILRGWRTGTLSFRWLTETEHDALKGVVPQPSVLRPPRVDIGHTRDLRDVSTRGVHRRASGGITSPMYVKAADLAKDVIDGVAVGGSVGTIEEEDPIGDFDY